MNRRDLMKSVASGALAAGTGPLGATAAVAPKKEAVHTSAWTLVHPGVWRATLGQPEVHTPVRSRRIAAAGREAFLRLPSVEQTPLGQLSSTVSTRGCELALPLAAGELMYGFGLQLLTFQQRSKKRTIRVNADPTVDSGDTHAPVPFYVTTRGYGVLVDTFRQATFYCGEAHPRPEQAQRPDSLEVNTPQMMRARDRTQTSRVLIEVPRCAGVDVYLFAGPELLHAVQRYNLFSGGGVLPPEWGLGFWYRPEMHLTAGEVLALAKDLRDSKIPCDVLGLEPGWQTHAYSCTFAWERSRFPEPATFVKQAGELGFQVNLWEHAFTHPASPIFTDLAPHSGDIAVWDGLVPDFAGEPARKVCGEYHGRALIDLGISGFKLDECDNSTSPRAGRFPTAVAFHLVSTVSRCMRSSACGTRMRSSINSAAWTRHLQPGALQRRARSALPLCLVQRFVRPSPLHPRVDQRRLQRSAVVP